MAVKTIHVHVILVKVISPNIFIPPFTGKPKQQRFTM